MAAMTSSRCSCKTFLSFIRSLRLWASEGGPSRRKAARCRISVAVNESLVFIVVPAVTAASFETSVEEQRARPMDKSERWKWMHGGNRAGDELRIPQPLLGANVLADGLRKRANALMIKFGQACWNTFLGLFLDRSSRPAPVGPF